VAETILGSALAFANHGHAVFPCNWPVERGGKLVCSCGGESRGRPCGTRKLAPNGLLSATTEPGIIKHWFGYEAREANLGVVTDNLIALDIDPRHDGDRSFLALEYEYGEMPPTWRVLTGGGEHILFAIPESLEIEIKTYSFTPEQTEGAPLGPGIDIRARRGYIVAPPSRHISGRVYAWNVDFHPKEVPIAPAPEWLIARLTGPRSAGASTTDSGPTPEPLPSDFWAQLTRKPVTDYRDLTAMRIAGHLFRHNCDYELVLGLLHAWNSAWCQPPLGYHELNEKIAEVANREVARIARECGQ
jgi:Bifunctional DNA primase/polymerase, N-terminal